MRMAAEGKVLIVGAGIGGLTAAVALRQAGRDVVVFEQNPAPLEVGAGFTMNSNAVTALRGLGLDTAVIEAGAELTRFVHHTRAGKVLAEWPTGQISVNVGAPIIGIGRPAVQRILIDALDGVEIRWGHTFTGFDQDRSAVTARFANGTEEHGAVLVGADGSRSVVLPIFDPTERQYSGYTTWLATSEFKDFAPQTHAQWYGPKMILGAHPIGGNRTYWYAGLTTPAGGSDPDLKRRVMELFGGWAEPLGPMLEATDPKNLARSDIYDLPYRASWGQGRVTLLGDAAHSMVPALGQGACQAVEDGVVLGRMLGSSTDEAATLRDYERKRIERVAPIVKRARMQGKLMQGDNPVIALVRNNIFRFAPKKQVLKGFQEFLTFPG
jgi:2-polyprenyl-6-methoxyphenol hydroxylase-like FAD-dependent oxidoreductase